MLNAVSSLQALGSAAASIFSSVAVLFGYWAFHLPKPWTKADFLLAALPSVSLVLFGAAFWLAMGLDPRNSHVVIHTVRRLFLGGVLFTCLGIALITMNLH
ncbi:hypothetical protein [Paraburkholderia sp. RL17-373-BIF-A]|uniref:hypothetical protein n=1 Tax=Paraburkholderia sp. RL17-373-BIF-A TaxID=3031629 RepID=UPI0038BC087D